MTALPKRAAAVGVTHMTGDLTERQFQIFVEYCAADTLEDAARRLGISPQTLKNSLTTVYRRLDVTSARQAAWRLWGPHSKAG